MIEKCALIHFSIIFRLFGDHWRSLALVYIFAGNGWTFSSFKNRFLSRPTYVLTIQHQAWNMSVLNWVLPASVWNCYFPTNQKRILEIERTKEKRAFPYFRNLFCIPKCSTERNEQNVKQWSPLSNWISSLFFHSLLPTPLSDYVTYLRIYVMNRTIVCRFDESDLIKKLEFRTKFMHCKYLYIFSQKMGT